MVLRSASSVRQLSQPGRVDTTATPVETHACGKVIRRAHAGALYLTSRCTNARLRHVCHGPGNLNRVLIASPAPLFLAKPAFLAAHQSKRPR
ncbi:hypothetical protein FOMPIDRAFT_1025786 [Fomitopsis schrenkii]|uniref:Uncharacterized protein n=1 Tax=Fomitopsis schrenkii TaxID=2126942 RepID=S8DQA2_FOMSC|nr:hypothetical protein FOMPIDRAFT_1025786 [Fomitopsis schrenkii]